MKLLPNYILQRIDLDGSYAEKLQYGSLSFLTYPKKKKEKRKKKKIPFPFGYKSYHKVIISFLINKLRNSINKLTNNPSTLEMYYRSNTIKTLIAVV